MIPLLGKEGLGVVAVLCRYHPPPLTPPPSEEGSDFQGSPPCLSADGYTETMGTRERGHPARNERGIAAPKAGRMPALQDVFRAVAHARPLTGTQKL